MEQQELQNTNLEKAKVNLAKNLTAFRKQAGLTQQELAEKLNYSDKNISKWERGEGIPDVLVLVTLAELYGVTVNDFLAEHKTPRTKHLLKNLMAKRWLVALLAFGLVWLVATAIVAIWSFADISTPIATIAKYAYLVAGPVSLVTLFVFVCIWGKLWQKCLILSLVCWSACVLVDVVVQLDSSWLIYLTGVVFQLLVVLWYLLRFFTKRGAKRAEAKQEEPAAEQ